jgi:hypothetical protein
MYSALGRGMDPNLSLKTGTKCLSAHIMKSEVIDKKILEKCFVCKHCTLRNMAGNVWWKLMKNMFDGDATTQLITAINTIFTILTKDFVILNNIGGEDISDVQYYLTTLISVQLINSDLNFSKLDNVFGVKGIDSFEYSLKDLIIGLPFITVNTENPDLLMKHERTLTEYYDFFEGLNMVDVIEDAYYGCAFKKYFLIDVDEKGIKGENERFRLMKQHVFENYKIVYGIKESREFEVNPCFEENYINRQEMNKYKYFFPFECKNFENIDRATGVPKIMRSA